MEDVSQDDTRTEGYSHRFNSIENRVDDVWTRYRKGEASVNKQSTPAKFEPGDVLSKIFGQIRFIK